MHCLVYFKFFSCIYCILVVFLHNFARPFGRSKISFWSCVQNNSIFYFFHSLCLQLHSCCFWVCIEYIIFRTGPVLIIQKVQFAPNFNSLLSLYVYGESLPCLHLCCFKYGCWRNHNESWNVQMLQLWTHD